MLETGCRADDPGHNLELSFYKALKVTMACLKLKTHLFLNSPLPWV